MPTYDFKCDNCGYRFELFLKITHEGDCMCPSCGGKARRVISAGGGILFKGSGFYATDYRKAEYKKESKKESED